MHVESMSLMKWLLTNHIPANHQKEKSLVDVGAYDVNGSYRSLCKGFKSYVGVDISDGDNVDHVITETGKWQEELGQTFDVVISGQTLEHVKRPWEWIYQARDLMTKTGWLFVIVPYACPIHRYSVDCQRIMPDGLHQLFKYAGLDTMTIGSVPHSRGATGDTFGVARIATSDKESELPTTSRDFIERTLTIHYSTSLPLPGYVNPRYNRDEPVGSRGEFSADAAGNFPPKQQIPERQSLRGQRGKQ